MLRWIMLSFLLPAAALAGEAEVLDAVAVKTGDTWRFDVTVRHEDTGWEHYADGWKIETVDGEELGFRVLHHPHVNEQPFTRSLGSVAVPEGVTEVVVRVRDNVHGWAGETYLIVLGIRP